MSHLLRGQVALKRKQWKRAEDANRRALGIDPTNNLALNNLGVALQSQRRWKEALEIYQQAAARQWELYKTLLGDISE